MLQKLVNLYIQSGLLWKAAFAASKGKATSVQVG
jgi:hypothetical protein